MRCGPSGAAPYGYPKKSTSGSRSNGWVGYAYHGKSCFRARPNSDIRNDSDQWEEQFRSDTSALNNTIPVPGLDDSEIFKLRGLDPLSVRDSTMLIDRFFSCAYCTSSVLMRARSASIAIRVTISESLPPSARSPKYVWIRWTGWWRHSLSQKYALKMFPSSILHTYIDCQETMSSVVGRLRINFCGSCTAKFVERERVLQRRFEAELDHRRKIDQAWSELDEMEKWIDSAFPLGKVRAAWL